MLKTFWPPPERVGYMDSKIHVHSTINRHASISMGSVSSDARSVVVCVNKMNKANAVQFLEKTEMS